MLFVLSHSAHCKPCGFRNSHSLEEGRPVGWVPKFCLHDELGLLFSVLSLPYFTRCFSLHPPGIFTLVTSPMKSGYFHLGAVPMVPGSCLA